MKIVKYQYHVLTWGGFYNEEYQRLHGLYEGDFFFDTEEGRAVFIQEREELSEKLDAKFLMFDLNEGYFCDVRTVLHRVTRYEGKDYYTTRDLGVGYPYETAKYHLQNKWCLGFNDYPLGKNFDYGLEEGVEVVSEWVTGAFDITQQDWVL